MTGDGDQIWDHCLGGGISKLIGGLGTGIKGDGDQIGTW